MVGRLSEETPARKLLNLEKTFSSTNGDTDWCDVIMLIDKWFRFAWIILWKIRVWLAKFCGGSQRCHRYLFALSLQFARVQNTEKSLRAWTLATLPNQVVACLTLKVHSIQQSSRAELNLKGLYILGSWNLDSYQLNRRLIFLMWNN